MTGKHDHPPSPHDSEVNDQEAIHRAANKLLEQLKMEEEVVVYCSHAACWGSIYAYQYLDKAGFKVRRYAGGISEWENAGYPLAGELGDN